jgi:hypothetical protein
MRRVLVPLIALLLASLPVPALAQSGEPSPSLSVATAPYDIEAFQGLQGTEQHMYRLHIWPGGELDLSGRAVVVIESGELHATPQVDLDIHDAADAVRSVSAGEVDTLKPGDVLLTPAVEPAVHVTNQGTTEAIVLVVNPPGPSVSGAPGASASP